MNRILKITIIWIFLASCGTTAVSTYNIPPTIEIKSHAEVMSSFKTKGQVFLEFGTPDQQMQVDSILNFYYRLGEETTVVSSSKSKNQGMVMAGTGNPIYSGVMAVYGNPFYTGNIGGPLYNNFSITQTNSTSNSNTTLKYVKFWMINDQVIKWESQGVDKSIHGPNPKYSYRAAQDAAARASRTKTNENAVNILGFTFISAIFIVIIMAVAG